MLKILFQLYVSLIVLKHAVGDDDQNIFSKFYQSDYSVKDDRPSVVSYNKQFMKEMSIVVFKYNRTTTVANITIVPLVDLTQDNMLSLVQIYKRYGNEYKTFPIRLMFNQCQALSNNVLGSATFKCGKLACPMLKNIRQQACNWWPDHSRAPPLMPEGQYLARISSTYYKLDLVNIEYMFTVYRKIKKH
ncbi:hypothetical protein RN001_010855 [Aquatica leii]|uniref:Uncharacterized protein n=1 Tax=Aquatica leii TaxID=1421715 RepID=A0AAN7P753_9COLE|nr:hypothetical protein RN001_010855 [Aquatica leii]